MNNLINQHTQSIKDYHNQLGKLVGETKEQDLIEDVHEENNFSGMLSQAINKIDKEVATSNNNIEKLITGELDNMHTAMIDMNKSQLVLQTAVQVRNKCVESYNDIKNMQF